MGIADSTGNLIAQYSYDEWGKVTVSATGEENIALANLNPLRYRGYYYDSETDYYYLQSRYYDPDICRFINSDLPEYAQVQKNETVGVNTFAYCYNNPIVYFDLNGNIAINTFFKMIGLGTAIYELLLCARLYYWGFTHHKRNQTYNFSKTWKSKIRSLLKKSTCITSTLNSLIRTARSNKAYTYSKTMELNFYKYHNNLSDLDLICSLGQRETMKFIIIRKNKTKSTKKYIKALYNVTCILPASGFYFGLWKTNLKFFQKYSQYFEEAHSDKAFLIMINNVGWLTQHYHAFVDFSFSFMISFDFWYTEKYKF